MNKSTKIILGLLPALIIAGVVYAAPSLNDLFIKLNLIQKQVDELQTQLNVPKLGSFQTQGYCFNTAAATTSVTYLEPVKYSTATPAIFPACDIMRADKVTLNLLGTGSTTQGNIAFLVEFSENGGDWFTEEVHTTATNLINEFASTTRFVQLGGNGQTKISIPIITASDGLQHKYARVKMWATGTYASSSVWSQFVKREFNN